MQTTSQKAVYRFLQVSYVLLAAGLSSTAALASLRERVPMSDAVTALHGAFFGWGLVLLAVTARWTTSRLRRSTLLAVAPASIGIGCLLFASATSVVMSLTGAAFFGLGAAGLVVAIPAVVASCFADRRSEVLTSLNITPAIGGMSVPLLVTLATKAGVSWRVPLFICGPALAVGALLVGRGPRLGGSLDHSNGPTLEGQPWRLFRDRPFRVRWVVQTVQIAIEFATGSWVVVFAREEAGFSAALAPLAAVAWGLGMMVARSQVQRVRSALGDRLEAAAFLSVAMTIGLFLVVRGPVLLVVVFAIAASFAPMYTLGVDRMYVTAAVVGVTDSGAISSLAALASGVGIIVGPLTIGFFADRVGLRPALMAPVAVAFGCAVAGRLRWAGEISRLGLAH